MCVCVCVCVCVYARPHKLTKIHTRARVFVCVYLSLHRRTGETRRIC